MPGFVVERHGYLTAPDLIAAVITDMIANGFVQKFPAEPFSAASITNSYKVILEAGESVDPLNAAAVAEKQPWRVAFNVVNPQLAWMSVATPLQLMDDGTITLDRAIQGSEVVYFNFSGNVGATVADRTPQGTYSTQNLNASGVYSQQGQTDETDKGLINRPIRITGNPNGTSTNPGANGAAAYPMSYRLVICDRGMWLGIWEDAITTETSAAFNWVLVQRPVDRTTGDVLVDGKAPVFCVNGIGGLYWQFVVREKDILRPGAIREGDSSTSDSESILNSKNQVALSEDGKYIVTFPSRLNTSRYRYPHELDMIGITSADVVSQFSDVPLTVYGESTPRSYKAMQANGVNNTGMRILVLQQGGGIS
jgi:hypothetical protein